MVNNAVDHGAESVELPLLPTTSAPPSSVSCTQNCNMPQLCSKALLLNIQSPLSIVLSIREPLSARVPPECALLPNQCHAACKRAPAAAPVLIRCTPPVHNRDSRGVVQPHQNLAPCKLHPPSAGVRHDHITITITRARSGIPIVYRVLVFNVTYLPDIRYLQGQASTL